MGLNALNYALQVKGDKSIASGFDHATRTGDNTFSIYFIDGSKVDLTIPLPKDGKDAVDITDVKDLGDGKFTLVLSDGSDTSAVQTIKGQKGDKGDKLTFNDLTDEEKASLKGDSGVSPTITENADNTDKIYKLDITTADTTFTTPNLKGADGQGGSGGSGEENVIESIKVNGVAQTVATDKSVDITVPTKTSDLSNDSGYLTEHQDISGKVDKVDGKSLIANTEIERLASVDNYDDTQVKTQIQAVANGLMDSVGYSADYKTIDIIAKNGVKKSVNVAPIISHASITELSDVDTTNKATGKALVYNATTSKHEYADVSGTDEKVKMDSSSDSKYLSELLDNVTITNENGELKVKKLDGQEVTITEINYLKGLTMNVMDLVNMFSNGGVKIINTPVATYAELLTIDKSSFIEGISYLVYVLADENHDNAKTTYLVDKDSETPTYFGFADSQRDFTTNPIDLATEITGKLGISNMDSDAIKTLFTVDDTYKTETATNNAFSTHGAKALYDELLLAIGNKANSSDLTAHKDDTDIHVSTTEKDNWNGKADASDLTVHTGDSVIHVTAENKATWNTVSDKVDKEEGKGLSSNDYTSEEKDKLGNIGTSQGRNLISYPYYNGTSYELNGITYTVNEADGTITVNGTATKESDFRLINPYEPFGRKTLELGQTYTLSDSVNQPNGIGYQAPVYFQFVRIDTTKNDFNYGISTNYGNMTWTASDANLLQYGIRIVVRSGVTADNVVMKPMLEIGAIAHSYEPTTESNVNLKEAVKGLVTPQGKNLISYPYTSKEGTSNGITWTVNDDGTITADGTATNNSFFNLTNYIVGKWGTLHAGTYTIMDGVNLPIGGVTLQVESTTGTQYKNKTFTIEQDVAYKIFIYIPKGTVADNITFKPMFEIGSIAHMYEPTTESNISLKSAIDGKADKSEVCVNMLNPTLRTSTLNGVTCTNNGDGTYTLNGTATEWGFFNLNYKNLSTKSIPVGIYKVVGGDKDIPLEVMASSKTLGIDSGNGYTFEIKTTDTNSWLRVVFSSGKTFNNVLIKPMITTNLNATYDDFVPYTGDGETLASDVAEIKKDLGGIDISSGVTALATFKIDSIDLKLRGNHVSGNIVVSLQSGGVFRDSYVLQIPKEYAPKFKTPITANGYLNSSTKYLPGYGIIGTDGKVLFYSNNETSINIAYISFSYDI